MKTRAIRVYADTSVFGGVFDSEFAKASLEFFKRVRDGRIQLVVSAIVRNEIRGAPNPVRAFFDGMLDYAEVVDLNPETIHLQRAYLKANVLTPRYELDALHVALATVSDCAIIVSWNFKHIVNFKKIPLYNAISMALGYKTIAIHSPMEVIEYEP